jgi:hypothetical protein
MMRLHAFKIEQKGSASLAAGDTIPLAPIRRETLRQKRKSRFMKLLTRIRRMTHTIAAQGPRFS